MPTPPRLGITAVRYLDQHIDSAHLIYDDESVSAQPTKVPRQTIVDALRNGANIVTLYKNADGTWGHWRRIRLITVDASEFLKLADDGKPHDDLGDLPEY